MELALATFLDLGLDRLETAIAAHGFAAIGTIGIFLANPAMSS